MTKTLTTERAVYDALCKCFEVPAYAVLPGVSNGTGGTKVRTIDALVMSLWPSRGLTLAGVEIKVSRGDLVRELADPAKQEPIFKFVDQFWLAVGDETIVRPGDVPETWGLLVPARGATKLKVAKPAPMLQPEPISRTFLAAILRRASEHLSSKDLRAEIEAKTRADVEAAVGEELTRLREAAIESRRAQDLLGQAALIDRFAQRSGIRFADWNKDAIDQAADIVKALDLGDRGSLLSSARYQAEHAKRVAERMREDADDTLAAIAQLEAQGLAPKTETPI